MTHTVNLSIHVTERRIHLNMYAICLGDGMVRLLRRVSCLGNSYHPRFIRGKFICDGCIFGA